MKVRHRLQGMGRCSCLGSFAELWWQQGGGATWQVPCQVWDISWSQQLGSPLKAGYACSLCSINGEGPEPLDSCFMSNPLQNPGTQIGLSLVRSRQALAPNCKGFKATQPPGNSSFFSGHIATEYPVLTDFFPHTTELSFHSGCFFNWRPGSPNLNRK